MELPIARLISSSLPLAFFNIRLKLTLIGWVLKAEDAVQGVTAGACDLRASLSVRLL